MSAAVDLLRNVPEAWTGLRRTPLEPFGLLVEASDPAMRIEDVIGEMRDEARLHRVVVFRGFAPPDGEAFVSAAHRLGYPLLWEFGAVNELLAKDDAKNYLYTREAVPFHWDGAFAKRAPEWILFHCVEAPDDGAGGETLFADTTRVVERATPQERARWATVTITYATEKIVHYGGEVTAALAATHPQTGEAVLRFAEPVTAALNPVSLEVHGAANPRALVAELQAKLYDPRVCLAHRWRQGDVVLADNHALVHGRRAFEERTPRRLRRVNVLERRPLRRVVAMIANLLAIRRPEFLPAEIPIVAIPLLLLAPFPAAAASIAEAIAILVLLFHFGDMVNCLADRELDRVYKARLARAVSALGVRSVAAQVLASALGALLLSIHLAWTLGQPRLVAMCAIGILLGAAYSVEPVRLKGRGAWGTLCVGLILFVGPMGFLSIVATGAVSPAVLALSISYALLQMGVILVNTAEDYPEDLAAGVRTTIVAAGLVRGIRAAAISTAVGAAGVFAVMAAIHGSALRLALVPLAAGLAFATVSVTRLAIEIDRSRSPGHGGPLPEAIAAVKRAAPRVPAWIAVTAWSTLLAAALAP